LSLSIFAAAEAAPERLALIVGSERFTFRELARKVEARLATLQAQGALDGDGTRPVAVLATPNLPSIETVLALLTAGTPALLLHPRSTLAERELLVQRASAVAEPPHAPASAPFVGPLEPFDPERIAVLVPTSGTTGSPRLARLSHRALLAAARASADHLGVEDDRWLLALPLAHVGGLMIVVRSLVARTAVVAFEPEGSLLANLPRLRSAIEDTAVTLLSLVPAVLERLLAAPEPW